MTKKLTTLLRFKLVTTTEHLLFNLRNFNFFRRSDEGKAIMLFGTSRFLNSLIAIPYIASSELVFFRATRLYVMLKEQIAGVLVVREEPDTLYISNLAVEHEYRERGIGTDMLNFCTRMATRTGKNWLELSVLKTNVTARRLYRKAGFTMKENRRWSLILVKKVTNH